VTSIRRNKWKITKVSNSAKKNIKAFWRDLYEKKPKKDDYL
jgi:hypothetical protein